MTVHIDGLVYRRGAALPDSALAEFDRSGAIIDFSAGHTFEVKVGRVGHAAAFTKTTGITGAATDPNVTIAWAASGELRTLEPGDYELQLTATHTATGKPRVFVHPLTVLASIS